MTLMVIVRWIATAVLIYLVYGETGPWTTLSLALITMALEGPALRLAIERRRMRRELGDAIALASRRDRGVR